ncbi:MAG: heme exporter protein CcmB [Bryobacteraceae bacterium]
MSIFLRQVWAIMSKDLRSEFRTKEAINASLAFSLVILLLFSFAFDTAAEEMKQLSGGLLWMVFAFAGTLVLNRSFIREVPNDCLDALLASPISGAALFLGKALGNFALLLAIEAACLPIFAVFYNVTLTREPGWLALVMVLATWALTVIGTMFSALTVNLRLRELMLPTLVYPMMIPALMAAIELTRVLVTGEPIGENMMWFRVLTAFDIIFTALAVTFVDTVLQG